MRARARSASLLQSRTRSSFCCRTLAFLLSMCIYSERGEFSYGCSHGSSLLSRCSTCRTFWSVRGLTELWPALWARARTAVLTSGFFFRDLLDLELLSRSRHRRCLPDWRMSGEPCVLNLSEAHTKHVLDRSLPAASISSPAKASKVQILDPSEIFQDHGTHRSIGSRTVPACRSRRT